MTRVPYSHAVAGLAYCAGRTDAAAISTPVVAAFFAFTTALYLAWYRASGGEPEYSFRAKIALFALVTQTTATVWTAGIEFDLGTVDNALFHTGCVAWFILLTNLPLGAQLDLPVCTVWTANFDGNLG